LPRRGHRKTARRQAATHLPVTRRDRQRPADIQAAIDAIRSHLQRGGLSDRLVFDAVRRPAAAVS